MTTLSREHFEERTFCAYFIKSVRFTAGEQFATSTNTTKSEMMKLDETGEYVDLQVSAMWFGYQIAMKAVQS